MAKGSGLLRRLLALHGTPWGIAGGFTLGLCLSLVPVPLMGMFAALSLAPLLRCNLPATYLGTAIINPVTGPFFYFAELWVGMAAMGRPLPRWSLVRELEPGGWSALLLDLLVPFAVGMTIMILATAIFCLPTVAWVVRILRRSAQPQSKA